MIELADEAIASITLLSPAEVASLKVFWSGISCGPRQVQAIGVDMGAGDDQTVFATGGIVTGWSTVSEAGPHIEPSKLSTKPKPAHAAYIHKPDDGCALRSVFLNGARVERCVYADELLGVVKYHAFPLRIEGNEVVTLTAHGDVRVEFLPARSLSEAEAESITYGGAIQPEPVSKGATAPTAPGLCRTAHDGERLGRLAWVPGA